MPWSGRTVSAGRRSHPSQLRPRSPERAPRRRSRRASDTEPPAAGPSVWRLGLRRPGAEERPSASAEAPPGRKERGRACRRMAPRGERRPGRPRGEGPAPPTGPGWAPAGGGAGPAPRGGGRRWGRGLRRAAGSEATGCGHALHGGSCQRCVRRGLARFWGMKPVWAQALFLAVGCALSNPTPRWCPRWERWWLNAFSAAQAGLPLD